MFALLFSVVLFFDSTSTKVQIAEDLQTRWKILSDGKFVDFDGRPTKTVHISIDLNKPTGHILTIQSHREFYLFINSTLLAKSKLLRFHADSLKRKYGKSVFISIHQPRGINHLSTQWVSQKEASPYENPIRPSRSFNNFVLISVLLLVIFFTSLLRNNPQLTLDYLNVIKLFAFKRRDDSQFVLRITSSVNLLFYLFCSLLTSLAIIVAVHFSENMSLSFTTDYPDVGGYFVLWSLLSLVIAALLMIKLGLAAVVSALFGWRDTAGFQFFNFIRLLVVSLVSIGIVSILAASLKFEADYYLLLKCICILLMLGAFLMFFKLLNRESTSAFHLFSYLCATEILPLVILIKVFLF
jgi:hypothetical protein